MTEREGRLVSSWEAITKDNEGEAHVHELHKYEYPPEEKDIEELLVRQAPPVLIRPSRRVRPEPLSTGDESFLLGGDAQIPFHDPHSMELFATINAEKKPHNVMLLGDMIDLNAMSRFQNRPEWVQTTQQAIDYFHMWLAQLRADNPQGRIRVVHGNHEQRLPNYVLKNAAELFGLRRAGAQKELGVLTLQYLVRYEDLGVEWTDGYPNGVDWLTDDAKGIHGTNAKKGGSNAAKYLNEEHETTFYGHAHRQELAYKTIHTRLGAKTIAAASPGALCLTDGSVPGFNHTVNAEGETVKKYEDWQSGIIFGHTALDSAGIRSVAEIEPSLMTRERGVRVEGKRYNA